MIRALAIAALAILMQGCVTAPQRGQAVSIAWVELDEQELQATCQARSHRVTPPPTKLTLPALMNRNTTSAPAPVNGCFDRIDGMCVVYTRKADDKTLLVERFQQTFGHEVLHCFKGLYHE